MLTLALAIAATPAVATSFSPGDVVVYRVGSGTGALGSSAAPVFFNEYEPSGKLVQALALPTTPSSPNKPLVASGSATSEGLLTLSGNDEYLLATGYDAAVNREAVAETESTVVPRTVARVSASGEVNTSTALTDFANKNNPRGATSSDGTHLWVGGAGKSTTGGVHFATLGSSTSTLMSASDTNARAVAVFDGQLYTSADPTKEGVNIATVGSGLPTTGGQTTANLPFATAPNEPYAFSFVTLGLGMAPDTLYVADNGAGAVVKFGLSGGKWVKQGSVLVSGVTGVTADDLNGTVSIYATNETRLFKITDSSGLGGELKGSAEAIASAPANEVFRGVAFTPGTSFGSGGAPPPQTPTITTSDASLAAALEDPTNPSLAIEVSDSPEFAAGELTVTASSANTAVAPQSGLSIGGSGENRTLTVAPAAVGTSVITLTVEAPNGSKSSTSIEYGVSAYQGDESDRYYAGAGNASSEIDVGGGYMIVADDETDVLRLYHERTSGPPVKTFDFTGKLPFGTAEMDIESSARAGNTLYWMGSLSNSKKGKLEPDRDVVFAATLKGSGAGTELEYLGSYTHLREDLVEWDEANGNPLGFAGSTASGVPSNEADGFNVEGLEFTPGSQSTAYVAFRAPLEPPNERSDALLVPVTDFSSLIKGAKATFGAPLEWNLQGRGIREIRKNAAGEYLVIAGTSDDSNSSFGLYEWDGNPTDAPLLTDTPISGVAEGGWEGVVAVPEPIADGAQVELIEDNGDSVWYDNGQDSKDGLPTGLQKDLGRLFTIELPTPSTPGAPHLASGVTPNSTGQFTLAWEAAHAPGAITYTLQHENASGGWSDVASGLPSAEYGFAASNPEDEGTWTYRVIASDESGESEPSEASEPIEVDETAPNAPSATPDRASDFAGGGGWYKDTVTVSFAGNGDPALTDGSPGSGVDPASIPTPVTFETSGSHEACGTVKDDAGNESTPGCLTVQVDATAPTVQVTCPTSVRIGASASATVTASDGQSGLAQDPSGTVPIDTSKAGPVTVTRTAIDNVGHETTSSCTTEVGFTQVIAGNVKGKLTVKAGQAVELTSTATVSGGVLVKAGGALDVEGATISGPLTSGKAALLRVCGADVGGALNASGSSGALVIGEGDEGCAANSINGTATVKGNTAGVTIVGNAFHRALKVVDNSAGVTVTGNSVAASLTVTGNSGTVVDRPNEVEGHSKLQ